MKIVCGQPGPHTRLSRIQILFGQPGPHTNLLSFCRLQAEWVNWICFNTKRAGRIQNLQAV